jgi:CheY-like chemotaxis protein
MTSIVNGEPVPSTARILLVDADAAVRASFGQALRPLGTVEVAATGADALRLLSMRKFSVVLLDLQLPLIDGFVVLRTLAARSGPNKETPVYAMTTDGSEQIRQRALREHAVYVMTKPVPIATLITLVDSALQKEASAASRAEAADAHAKPPSSAPPPPDSAT